MDAQYVPIAPAKCCKLCLGKLHKMSTCAIHDNCSGARVIRDGCMWAGTVCPFVRL